VCFCPHFRLFTRLAEALDQWGLGVAEEKILGLE
jgi:hypothetical protein